MLTNNPSSLKKGSERGYRPNIGSGIITGEIEKGSYVTKRRYLSEFPGFPAFKPILG
jgi:hypothetical protein